MILRHYDVIVIGRSIGALTAAALLARRDFTVMVVGHGERPPTYRIGLRQGHIVLGLPSKHVVRCHRSGELRSITYRTVHRRSIVSANADANARESRGTTRPPQFESASTKPCRSCSTSSSAERNASGAIFIGAGLPS